MGAITSLDLSICRPLRRGLGSAGCVAFMLLSLLQVVCSETSSLGNTNGVTTEYVELSIKPDAKHVQFLEVNLDAPGYIDLSDLEFSTVDNGHDPENLAVGGVAGLPSDGDVDDDDDDTIVWDDDWSHQEKKTTMLDVAVVYIPDDCGIVKEDSPHCDFTEVGVGRRHSEIYGLLEEPYWCCTDEEVMMELCDGSVASYGRMMMNLTNFDGSHRFIEVPPYGEVTQNIAYAQIEEQEHSGKYAIILANCYEEAGREVVMRGDLKVKSSGTVPAQFNTAMKSFAKKSIERTEQEKPDKNNNDNSNDSSGYSLTIAILVLGLAGAAYIARGNLGRITMAMSRGYNTLELSEMEGPSSENNYVPFSSSW